ncbi:hypothetical protein [Amycolatopsis taiwanensis]|uniref:hypothetical protein n=1 Tax=Amycolatopsis taiwanensis TaxID=342230 RepID=UPI0025567F6F|nr:hypothetical protein [Amycolatopsis taiwanensis]
MLRAAGREKRNVVRIGKSVENGTQRHGRRDRLVIGPFPGTWSTGWWYMPLSIGSLGLLSWIPFIHAAVRLSRPSVYLWAVTYCVGMVAVLVVLPADDAAPAADLRSGVGLLLMIAMATAGSLQQRYLRRMQLAATVPGPFAKRAKEPAAEPATVEDRAVTRVRLARERRQQARELAASDPLMARELRIGRPDLPHRYDDGGLVDLNNAPAKAIAKVCGIDLAAARMIVEARAGAKFLAVDDVFVLTDLPVDIWDVIRDHGIVM